MSKPQLKKAESKNRNCIVDNSRYVSEFDSKKGLYEFYQIQPDTEDVREYHRRNKEIESDKLSIELKYVKSKLKTCEESEKLDLLYRESELESQIEEKYKDIEPLTYLMEQTFKNTEYQEGKITLNGEFIGNDIKKLYPLPAMVKEQLLLNALKLITYKEDEQKN